MLLRWVNHFSCLQSDFDKNSKEVTPFSSAFTRQREIWAGRTASTSLSVASQVSLHLMALSVCEEASFCLWQLRCQVWCLALRSELYAYVCF